MIRHALLDRILTVATCIAVCGLAYREAFAAGWVTPTFEKERPIVEQLWKQTSWSQETKDCRGQVWSKWHFELGSLPFPDPWPPKETGSFVYYVFARELCPRSPYHLHETVTGPWARIVLANEGAGIVERLPVQDLRSTTRGHRITKDDAAILNNRQTVLDYIAALKGLPDESDPRTATTRRFYCFVIPRGLIFFGQSPEQYHDGFVRWLACPKY